MGNPGLLQELPDIATLLSEGWLPDTSHSETVMRQPAVGAGVAVAVAQSA